MKLEIERKVADYLDEIDKAVGTKEERRKILREFALPEPSLGAKVRIFLNMYLEEFGEEETNSLLKRLF
jgi:hypothetical protein